jgi:LuxR family maltose regulon positive regulatory protein
MTLRTGVEGSAFGELLRRHRLEAGLSQEALAERARMSARGVGDLERGVRRCPYPNTITRLATALELNASERAALQQAGRRVRKVRPRKTTSADAVSNGSPATGNELLVSKITPSVPRASLVSRPRLLEQMDAGLQDPLTLIAAPAGSGKTTLLGAWCATLRNRDVRVAWISLDAGDNDPSRFWRYVLAALERSIPGVSEEAMGLLEPPRPADIETVLTALLNALTAFPGDVALILEDYHLITAGVVHESVAYLLEHLPPQTHLVLATRTDPPLPLARLRAGGMVTELRTADLRFTIEEAATFLIEIMGLSLDDEEFGVLEQRTEGWIAGMQLAALSLYGRSADEVSAFIAAFSGSHRHVVDYLTDEVLARCSEPVQDFLLRTSILDRMNASVCAFLMYGETTEAGVRATQELLEELESSNLFVLPLDDHREWYRYHQLFADAMRHRLRHRRPDLVSGLHERASDWFENRELVHEAIGHAVQAGAFELAARLIERVAPKLHASAARLTVEGWLAALSPEAVETRRLIPQRA